MDKALKNHCTKIYYHFLSAREKGNKQSNKHFTMYQNTHKIMYNNVKQLNKI
jgi:hypothetical protein